MEAKICATVAAPTMAELRARRDSVSGADLVELRLDFVDAPDVAGALADRQLPVIVTCRPTAHSSQAPCRTLPSSITWSDAARAPRLEGALVGDGVSA